MPPQAQFKSPSAYYATALHELGHWTGHESRLNRNISCPFGSEEYAKEELRAEIASMLMGDELGIGHDPSKHVAYIKSWIKVLEDDPLEIFRAGSDAEKILTHVMSIEQTQEQELTSHVETKDETLKETKSMGSTPNDERTWLEIPFHQKDTVKLLVGKLADGRSAVGWDKELKRWYAREGACLETLKPWIIPADKEQNIGQEEGDLLTEKTWLAIPFKKKDTAKSIVGRLSNGTPGIAWDNTKKCWYANPGIAREKISSWLPEKMSSEQPPILDPFDEFKDVLISLGANITDNHPIMDGQPHRISAEGDKKGERALFYVGHLDGMPAGYIKNNRTGIETKWRCKGYALGNEEKALLNATAAKHKMERDKEIDTKQKSSALRIQNKIADMHEIKELTPYIKSKGVKIYPGVYTDDQKKITAIPATDIEGAVWTVQYISEDGTKRFAKDSKKQGCFHAIGGIDSLADAPVIIIAEGYATAATIKEATDVAAVVSAFDAGNLKAV